MTEGVELMYNEEEEKLRAIDFVEQSLLTGSADQKMKKSEQVIQFALDEVQEFEDQFFQFCNSLQYMPVFKDAIQPQLKEAVGKIIEQTRYLIEKNYSHEELNKMPKSMVDEINEIQRKRVDLLKTVAKIYLTKSQKKEGNQS